MLGLLDRLELLGLLWIIRVIKEKGGVRVIGIVRVIGEKGGVRVIGLLG